MASNDLINLTAEYVFELLREKLPAWAVYHSYNHTKETAEACEMLSEGLGLSKSEREVALLAAWFHDTGYVDGAEGHEERSAEIAKEFLQSREYPHDRIDLIVNCIRATKLPQTPRSLPEEVLCDADMAHIGKKKFFEKSELMRMEFERRLNRTYTDTEWLLQSVEFVSSHRYNTHFAQAEFEKQRTKNLLRLQEQLREALSREDADASKQRLKSEKASFQSEKAKIPERGIETMFRVTISNHINLSSIADHKANLLISTNSIILSIIISVLVRKLDESPHLVIPTLILSANCVATIIFGILATIPKYTEGKVTREDIRAKKANLLFFGNFHNMELEDFEWGMKSLMNDRDYLYSSMITDLYFLGRVLGRKYRFLRFSYNVFMYGIIVSVIAYSIALIIAPTPTL